MNLNPKQRWTDAVVRPVKKTLFGDADYKEAPRGAENAPVVPIGRVMADLCGLSPDAWTDYAFAREPLNGRISASKRHELMGLAQRCGTEWSHRLSDEFHTSAPVRIAEGLGATVEYRSKPHGEDRVLFAEFVEPDSIYVYEDAMNKAQELLRQEDVREVVGPRLRTRALLVAHEVFHVVELQHADEIWTETFRIDTLGLGPFHNRSRLVVLSEIAAMAFAQTLLDLTYSSYVMDVLMTYAYSPEAGTSLYQEVMGYQAPKSAAEGPDAPKGEDSGHAGDEEPLSAGSLASGFLGEGLPDHGEKEDG